MNKNTIVIVSICFVLSTLLVICLYAYSDYLTHKRNSFIRLFPPFPITEGDELYIEYNSYYVAGHTGTNIYLANRTAPLHLLVLDMNLRDTQHVQLKIRAIEKYQFRSVRVAVDSPNFYMTDGSIPAVFKGTTDTWVADRYTYDSAFFLDCIPLSKNSFAIRTISSKSNEYVLGKEWSDSPHIKLNHDLLEKQLDGIFCVDGDFKFNKQAKRIVYTYYYRNQFIVIDTNLNLIQRFNTIDTNSRAKIHVAPLQSGKNRAMSQPPLMVNKRTYSFDNWLLIQSNLLAKNERKELFDNSTVIDVYDLHNGIYQFSFYIPDLNHDRVQELHSAAGKLIVLSGKYIRTFNLSTYYFGKNQAQDKGNEQY